MLTKIADVLTNYSTAGIVSTIPRVHLNYTYDPNDIGDDMWKLQVTLEGIEAIQEDGKVLSKVSREWEARGVDPDTCATTVTKQIKESLESDLLAKRIETSAMERAIEYLTSDRQPEDLPNIWAQTKEQAGAMAAMEEQNGQGWAEPPADDAKGSFKVVDGRQDF
jgi:hypothetical protein